MRRIEHGALMALSPDTRKSSAVPYQSQWREPGYALTVTSDGGGR
ncbi:MAG: hypothetical protein WAK86_12970 [Pseudonocardiaceae bacterium]